MLRLIDFRLWATGLVVLAVLLLCGCMAVPIAAMGMAGANSANILAGDRSVVTQLEDADRAKLAAVLRGSKRIVLLDSGPATATAAETLEKAGLVAPVAQQFGEVAKMSPSQQRDAMQKACTSERGDAVIAGRTGDARTNRMTYLIGKADTELDMDVQVLACKTNAAAMVRVVFKFDAAIQGSPQESYRRAGVSFGKVVTEVAMGN